MIGALLALALASAPAPRAQTPADDPTRGVGIDQRLGERIPLETTLRDETGATVVLGELFDERPVVLALVYYECPMLCTLVTNGVLDALRVVTLEPGSDYEVVFVSIDPGEGPELAAANERRFLDALERPDAGDAVHFLTGEKAAIDAVASAVGFRYVYDERSGEYAHASGIVVATPDGVVSRYLLGVEYGPRDLRLSLVEASEGEVGSLVDQVLLLCYAYDPTTGKYGLAIVSSLRGLGVLTVVALGAFVFRSLRRERIAAREGRS